MCIWDGAHSKIWGIHLPSWGACGHLSSSTTVLAPKLASGQESQPLSFSFAWLAEGQRKKCGLTGFSISSPLERRRGKEIGSGQAWNGMTCLPIYSVCTIPPILLGDITSDATWPTSSLPTNQKCSGYRAVSKLCNSSYSVKYLEHISEHDCFTYGKWPYCKRKSVNPQKETHATHFSP